LATINLRPPGQVPLWSEAGGGGGRGPGRGGLREETQAGTRAASVRPRAEETVVTRKALQTETIARRSGGRGGERPRRQRFPDQSPPEKGHADRRRGPADPARRRCSRLRRRRDAVARGVVLDAWTVTIRDKEIETRSFAKNTEGQSSIKAAANTIARYTSLPCPRCNICCFCNLNALFTVYL